MKTIGVFTFLLVLFSCVDRIDLFTNQELYPIVVEGFISDQPGPYEIRISRSFDVQSKTAIKTNISAKMVTLFDDGGNSEVLKEYQQGFYRTDAAGITGIPGRSYKLRVELLDGKVYESVPDKMTNPGLVDSIYFSFVTEKLTDLTTQYGFDVFFDSDAGEESNSDYLWRFVGTYQVDTNPEAHKEQCGEGFCPRPRPCSGWIAKNFELSQVGPCECCTCWVDFYNEVPIVSDGQFVQNGKYANIKAYRVPLTQWIFMKKVYVRVEQMSLTPKALAFWKAIKAQKQATGSLFQPVSGIVPNNFIQIGGDPALIEGFFFATSIRTKGTFITRDDVPNQLLIPNRDLPFEESCLTFPNSTNQLPSFWR